MITIRFAAAPVLLLLIIALAGCVSDGLESARGVARAPGLATYQCDDGGQLRVENMGSSVKLHTPRGLDVALPASPPDSTSRYGSPPYALVLDGREALWFVTGKPPLTCRR